MVKILMATSEASPFAKTGGLADVLGSLPSALLKLGADVRVIMPKYGTIPEKLRDSIVHNCYIYINLGWRHLYCGIERAKYNGVTYYFIDNEDYFNRASLYGYNDDCERFAFFCKAVMAAIPYLDFIPDVIHCHDWQSGMIPVLLESGYRHQELYKNMSTVFTIHNLRYQGIYGIDEMKEWFDLNASYFTDDKLEFYHSGNFMKGGLVYAHMLTTVSETYAQEIKNPFYGERMDGLLNARSNDLHGIVNGIDYEEFNSQKDPLIYQNFSKSNLKGKAANKAALQQDLKLTIDEEVPIIGLISRLVDQKGLDLIACVLDEILSDEVQLVVLGTGDEKYERLFNEAMNRYPGKVSANIRFDNGLAHKIYAASDYFLMPSLFEPCGLGQLISLRYGTLPIVRETGGLKDTVISYNDETGEGNGFSFTNYNAHDMLNTIRRALSFYQKKTLRTKLRKAAMSCDYSWLSSAEKYLELYRTLKPEA
ncbi:MAG: glycogen synthase GlgA [Herbinix sp.]|nr:glycogen synthase GlgA [Herbinix sp.]